MRLTNECRMRMRRMNEEGTSIFFFFWQHSLFLYHVFCYAGDKGETGVEQNMPGWFRTNGIRAKVLMDVSKRDLGNTRIKRKGEVLRRVCCFFLVF